MEGTVVLATECTITVAGSATKNGQKVAITNFNFTPPFKPIEKVSMICAELPDSFHVPLYNVMIIQTGIINSLWIDDFTYTLKN